MGFPEKLLARTGSEWAKLSISWGFGGGSLSPAFSKSKESTARNSDLEAGENCLGSDLFYFPLRKPL